MTINLYRISATSSWANLNNFGVRIDLIGLGSTVITLNIWRGSKVKRIGGTNGFPVHITRLIKDND